MVLKWEQEFGEHTPEREEVDGLKARSVCVGKVGVKWLEVLFEGITLISSKPVSG